MQSLCGYKILGKLGEGTYGAVYKAGKGTRTYALKQLKIGTHRFAESGTPSEVIRELDVVKALDSPYCLKLESLYACQKKSDPAYCGAEVVMTYALAKSDLDAYLRSHKTVAYQQLKTFLFQILCGIHHLHMNNIAHLDLKLPNILVMDASEAKGSGVKAVLADFGLARRVTTGMDRSVISRWWRPPELIFSSREEYNTKADIWSYGCLVYEILTGAILFPSEDEDHQMEMFQDRLGFSPRYTPGYLKHYPTSRLAHIKKATPLSPDTFRIPIKKYGLSAGEVHNLLELANSCLEYNQEDRPSAGDLLKLRYFAGDEKAYVCPPSCIVYPELALKSKSPSRTEDLKFLVYLTTDAPEIETLGGDIKQATFYLAIDIYDRYCTLKEISVPDGKHLMAVAFHLASKIFEKFQLTLDELSEVLKAKRGKTLSATAYTELECDFCSTLKYIIYRPTVTNYLDILVDEGVITTKRKQELIAPLTGRIIASGDYVSAKELVNRQIGKVHFT